MQQTSYKKLRFLFLVCSSFFIIPFCAAASMATSEFPACTGTMVSSCGNYTSSSTCLTTYYVFKQDQASYCSWNGTACVEGSKVYCTINTDSSTGGSMIEKK